MKKNLAIILTIILLVLTGCSSNNLTIEGSEWIMSTVQDSAASEVIFCSVQYASSFPDAKHVTVKAEFDKGCFNIDSGASTYKGTYSISKDSARGLNLYELLFEDGSTAAASLNTTKYHDGSKKPTLIITTAHYTVYFYPNENEASIS